VVVLLVFYVIDSPDLVVNHAFELDVVDLTVADVADVVALFGALILQLQGVVLTTLKNHPFVSFWGYPKCRPDQNQILHLFESA
jgi:ABC-type glucose/galactose transport system permease subunit